MTNWTLKITQGDPTTGVLTMDPPGDLVVVQGDTVTWEIVAGSGVAAITKISEKPMSFDLFNPDPVLVTGTTSWKGTVNPEIGSNQSEQYFITWTTAGTGWLGKDGGGISKTFDPRISVKPIQTS
tara:strand:+ start:8027 stop:8401 length:375 start_codon:yes stop_codon:yes gene_type:complete